MTDMPPVTIDDVIERMNELKAEHGNIEVRRYEGRHAQHPTFDTYPKFCTMPTDKGSAKIVVIL
tara:strand:- start:398 stop:589 length:192 start_codon:yes stop_codon:yes gene_type:complete